MIAALAVAAFAEDGRPSGAWLDLGVTTQIGQWQSLRRGWSFDVLPFAEGRAGWGALFVEGRLTATDGLVVGCGRLGIRPIRYEAVSVHASMELTTLRFEQSYLGADVEVPGLRRWVATAEAELDDSAPFAVGGVVGLRWRAW